MTDQKVMIINFGGQYDQLIARRVRELNVYSEIFPSDVTVETIKNYAPKAIILTGGPKSVYEVGAFTLPEEVLQMGIPILGICYGCQLLAKMLGGSAQTVTDSRMREYGKTTTYFDTDSPLFYGILKKSVTWMSHGDKITCLPERLKAIANSKKCPFAAIADEENKIYGVQFHPEVTHTVYGRDIIKNFLIMVAEVRPDWRMADLKETLVSQIKQTVGDGKVLLALSGGVDSAVAAALLKKAVGKNLTCVFVDHGFMRKGEPDLIEKTFSDGKINFIRLNEQQTFLSKLKGVTEPEQKRKIIGKTFIEVFEKIADKIGEVDYFAQGTIYPDVIESGKNEAQTIKSHHNVGGLPSVIKFKKIIEPLRSLFKDEVRMLGQELGLNEKIVYRQPFPGPGLAIRVIGEVTEEKLNIVRQADAIFTEEIEKAKKFKPAQYFACLTNMRSVGVMGDKRTYSYAVALRAVETEDFMTCEFSKLSFSLLEKISLRIVNEVAGVNRVLFDVTGKPPSTVEYE